MFLMLYIYWFKIVTAVLPVEDEITLETSGEDTVTVYSESVSPVIPNSPSSPLETSEVFQFDEWERVEKSLHYDVTFQTTPFTQPASYPIENGQLFTSLNKTTMHFETEQEFIVWVKTITLKCMFAVIEYHVRSRRPHQQIYPYSFTLGSDFNSVFLNNPKIPVRSGTSAGGSPSAAPLDAGNSIEVSPLTVDSIKSDADTLFFTLRELLRLVDPFEEGLDVHFRWKHIRSAATTLETSGEDYVRFFAQVFIRVIDSTMKAPKKIQVKIEPQSPQDDPDSTRSPLAKLTRTFSGSWMR